MFDEVAIAIQEKRYEDAISKDPTPFRDIKPPSKRVLEEFITNREVTLQDMLYQPLGRHFLEKFADVSSTEEGGLIHLQRDSNGPQHKMLAFLTDFLQLAKRNKNNLVFLVDILLVVERHDMIDFFDQALAEMQKNGSPNKSMVKIEMLSVKSLGGAKTFESLKRDLEAEVGEISFLRTPTLHREKPSTLAEPPRLVNNLNAAQEFSMLHHTTGSGSLQEISAFDESEGPGGINSVVTSSFNNLTRSHTKTSIADDFESIHEENASLPASVAGPSLWTRDINAQILVSVGEALEPLFTEFKADSRMLREYLRFQIFLERKVSEKCIQKHRTLGQGAFGIVYGCMVGEIGVMMALKEMTKKRIKRKKANKQVLAELKTLRLLAENPSPYCMRLRYAYETKDTYNVIIPLALGGDLKFQLRAGNFHLDRVKIYAAEIAFGLSHLHSLGIINRDLKLRNILLDHLGHCKISDFGLAVKLNKGSHKGRAGTDGYWSPEVISGKSYAYDCDWWSYGCCLFEMAAGFNPFSRGHTGLKTRNEGTLSGAVTFPEEFNEGVKVLVSELLCSDRSKRICVSQRALEDLMGPKFAFWEGVDLEAIRLGSGPAAWVPQRGKVYADHQKDIHDNVGNDGKVRLKKEDAIHFPYFIDSDLHQQDLVSVLHKQSKHPRLSPREEWTSAEEDFLEGSSCECVLS